MGFLSLLLLKLHPSKGWQMIDMHMKELQSMKLQNDTGFGYLHFEILNLLKENI